jgi:Rrf2 family transcriptional regulator, cysteine metabolism repressor
VNVSVKSDYAARAVLSLARHYATDSLVRTEDVAREQGVPPHYLSLIMVELKDAGIVQSVRGKAGGYLLGRPPAEITLGDVLRAVQGTLFEGPPVRAHNCPPELRRAWRNLQESLEASANSITFQQLLEEGSGKEKMYYI